MTETLRIEKSVKDGVLHLLRHLLESQKVGAVFALRSLSENKAGNAMEYSLITNVDALDDSSALFPIMPRNAGGLLAQLTQKGEVPLPVAVFVRPCELRALVELAKRNRSNLKDLFVISSTCPGVFPTKMMINGELKKNISGYWDAIKRNKTPKNIKSTCRACTEFVPYNSDMTVWVLGQADIHKECHVSLNSTKAREYANGMDGEITDEMQPSDALEKIRKRIRAFT